MNFSIKHGIFLAALASSVPAQAASTIDKVLTFDQNNNPLIYHNTDVSVSLPLRGWTTDKNSGLDWLDVTATMGMTYDQVNNNSLYNGWHYATNTELNTLVTDATNINLSPSNPYVTTFDTYRTVFRQVTIKDIGNPTDVTYTHLFDPLINMLGSRFC